MVDKLELGFHDAMLGIYHRAKCETGYNATYFLQMVNARGGLDAAKRLVATDAPSEGYTKLWELGRLDISVEALIHDNPKWHGLFTRQELNKVRDRLDAYGYFGSGGGAHPVPMSDPCDLLR